MLGGEVSFGRADWFRGRAVVTDELLAVVGGMAEVDVLGGEVILKSFGRADVLRGTAVARGELLAVVGGMAEVDVLGGEVIPKSFGRADVLRGTAVAGWAEFPGNSI